MWNILNPALRLFVALSIVTGIAYPLAVTGLAQGLFPGAANGSLVEKDGKVVGSRLIGQKFESPRYFWSRPSAVDYNGAGSGGSNLGPTNPALKDAVAGRIAALRAAHPGETGPIPVELVTASGSGLDPHLSPAAVYYQAGRVARARGMSVDKVRALIAEHTQGRALGFLGEPVVNVLELNLALDAQPAS